MAGRRPKPTALKLIAGNPGKRKINPNEPKPNRKISPPPPHLDELGQSAWLQLSLMLDAMGVITEADALALERLCECYAEIIECAELIKQDGRTYKTQDQNGHTLIKNNPAVSQLRAVDAQFKSYLVEFGLTPAARSKIHAHVSHDVTDTSINEFFD